MDTISFTITDLSCVACVKLSMTALKKISGVHDAAIDLKSGQAELVSERKIAWSEITSALETVNKHAQS